MATPSNPLSSSSSGAAGDDPVRSTNNNNKTTTKSRRAKGSKQSNTNTKKDTAMTPIATEEEQGTSTTDHPIRDTTATSPTTPDTTTTVVKPAQTTTARRLKPGDGFGSGLLAIGIYALMHESGIMTILLLAFVWYYSLEESHQRIFLFFLVLLNFAEYFYLLPPVLARYQKEDWYNVGTLKTVLSTMALFWTIAWFSAWTGSYLEHKEQQRNLDREKRRLQQFAMFHQYAAEATEEAPTTSTSSSTSTSS